MAETYYGAPSNSENKNLRERLRDYYSDSEFVTVQNIDTKPLTYQFMPPENQEFVQTAAYAGELYNKKNPVVETLQPGQTKLCPAYEADLMLEVLIKQITSRKVAVAIEMGDAQPWQSANWSDPQTQTNIIEQAFLGKQDLIGSYNASLNKKTSVDIDLELDKVEPVPTDNPIGVTSEPRRRGRQPKSAE